MSADGLLLFARYAYPPNELGYCGPDDHRALLEYGTAGVADRGLGELAKGFTGPWPYLTLLAGAAGTADPFDARVVEAYWIGNRLLRGVSVTDFGNTLADRFAGAAGRAFRNVGEAVGAGAVPHHAFHVFAVYPWVGLLTSGRSDEPLRVLDRCRIRPAQVVTATGDEVVVRSRPLTWDGRRLALGPPRAETVRRAAGGLGFLGDLRPGEWISCHWDWACDRLDRRQVANLRRYTGLQLDITNRRVAHPGPAAALG